MSDDGIIILGALGLLALIIIARSRSGAVSSSQNKPLAVNSETWEWTDWKGRPRTITVHREVR